MHQVDTKWTVESSILLRSMSFKRLKCNTKWKIPNATKTEENEHGPTSIRNHKGLKSLRSKFLYFPPFLIEFDQIIATISIVPKPMKLNTAVPQQEDVSKIYLITMCTGQEETREPIKFLFHMVPFDPR